MTTVTAIRTTYLNSKLRRAEADTVPWTDTACAQAITDALSQLWQDGIGNFASGTAATSAASDVYTVPTALAGGRVSRIELEQASGGVSQMVARVTSWQRYSATEVRIRPRLPTDSTLVLRFFGWVPYKNDATDLPVRLENVVAMKAAALAYGELASHLANSQTQQGLDEGRVVDYPTAVGLSAYWERRYRDEIEGDPDRVSYAPRHAHR